MYKLMSIEWILHFVVILIILFLSLLVCPIILCIMLYHKINIKFIKNIYYLWIRK